MRKLVDKLKRTVIILNALALMVVFQNVNAACVWIDHQPEVSEEAKRFKIF